MNWWNTLKNKHKAQTIRAIKLFQSNYGRTYGWYIELNNVIIGELQHPVQIEMFWESYQIIPTHEKYKDLLNSAKFWNTQELKFKNKGLNEYAEHAFPGGMLGEDINLKGQVSMRALYLTYNSNLEKMIAYFYDFCYHQESENIQFSSTKFKTIEISYREKTLSKWYTLVINHSGKVTLKTYIKKGNDHLKEYWIPSRKVLQIQRNIKKYKLFNIKQLYLDQKNVRTQIQQVLTSKKSYLLKIWNHTDNEPKELRLSLNSEGKNIEHKMIKEAIEAIEQIAETGLTEQALIH